jgi:hypothetical protein
MESMRGLLVLREIAAVVSPLPALARVAVLGRLAMGFFLLLPLLGLADGSGDGCGDADSRGDALGFEAGETDGCGE